MRVLLVEDDPMIGEAIQGSLKDASYATDWVKDGQTALTTLGCQHYDLVLLDLGLPGKDGLEVLASIRAKDNPVPLLIITARDGLDDRLRGLDGGADDYVSKPFQMAELLARMRAVLRRKGGTATPVLTNGVVSLDPATKEASVNGGSRCNCPTGSSRCCKPCWFGREPSSRAASWKTASTAGGRGRKQRRRISDPCTAAQAGQRGHQERQGVGWMVSKDA
jgi:two-component system OmpR family response regulator